MSMFIQLTVLKMVDRAVGVGNHRFEKQQPALCLTCRLEDPRVALAVPRGERLHHTVNLLGFTWQTETPQELPTVKRKSRGM